MRILVLALLFPCLALALSGCGASHASPVAVAEPVPAATYKAGYGVQLAPVAREFISLQTADAATGTLDDGRQATIVPLSAVLRTVRGDFVYVTNGDWFLRTPVAVGAIKGAQAGITAGLYEGDTVVVHGVRALALAEMQALNGGVGCADGH